jgi:hypothetical protein
VDGLTAEVVTSSASMVALIEKGTDHQTVAITAMNAQSSRSHVIFGVTFTRRVTDKKSGINAESSARISFVDLAGSERSAQQGPARFERRSEHQRIPVGSWSVF